MRRDQPIPIWLPLSMVVLFVLGSGLFIGFA